MNEIQTDKLETLLFKEGRELVNIKFFPGTSRGLTSIQLSDAAAGAIKSALEKGPINCPPVTGKSKVALENL